MAFDLYPNGEDGPHFGYQFKCPAAGVVTRYSFGPGPLGLQCQVADGFTGDTYDAASFTELWADTLLTPSQREAFLALGTFMHIAVLTFDQPQRTPGGYVVKAIWKGHVQDGFATGRRNKGDDWCKCGKSGVEFPHCDASHSHDCGTATGQLSPNGDVPGIEVVKLQGFNPRVTTVPGPREYQGGGWDRGKRKR